MVQTLTLVILTLLVRKNQKHNVVLQAMKYIACTSNSTIIRNADYLLSQMETMLSKMGGKNGPRLKKTNK